MATTGAEVSLQRAVLSFTEAATTWWGRRHHARQRSPFPFPLLLLTSILWACAICWRAALTRRCKPPHRASDGPPHGDRPRQRWRSRRKQLEYQGSPQPSSHHHGHKGRAPRGRVVAGKASLARARARSGQP